MGARFYPLEKNISFLRGTAWQLLLMIQLHYSHDRIHSPVSKQVIFRTVIRKQKPVMTSLSSSESFSAQLLLGEQGVIWITDGF